MVLSPYILAIITGWIIAQGTKYVVAAVKTRSFRVFDRLYISGNMPSAHSATVLSVTTIIAFRDGFDSAVFGIALALALVVMYDAMMVRRSVGEQGESIRGLIVESKSSVATPRIAKGHTPLEVVVGALVGVLSGVVVFLATK